MISVVISTYNRKEKLRRAIESVLKQTYTDWELVVVADGPQNYNFKSFIDSFFNRKIKGLVLPRNFGCDTKPKNEGIMATTGNYIAFLDDDNEFKPEHLAILMKGMSDYDTDVVYGDRVIIDDATGQVIRPGIHSDFDSFLLMRQNFIDTSDVLVKREALYKVGGFDESIKKFIDWNLWVRMDKLGLSFKRIPQIITNYYIHENMKSVKNPDMTMTFDPFDCVIELPYLGNEVSEPLVAVFSLTYDRLDMTKECFRSLHETAGYPFDHFVVDNGSTDGTKEWLQEQFDKNLVYWFQSNEDNKGISIASNQALSEIKEFADYNIVVKVDNDAYFKTQDWLKTMVKIWKSNRKIALSCYIEGLRDSPGGSPRIDYGNTCGELIGFTQHLGGIVHFVDISAYKDFEWDEQSTLHGVQDLEFSQHLTFKGYGMGYLENYYCEHRYGTSGQHERYPEYFKRRELEKTQVYEKNEQSQY